MKKVLWTLLAVLLLVTMLSACNEGEKKDDTQLEPLLAMLFLAPNEEIETAQENALAAAHEEGNIGLENYLDPFYEEYVAADYLRGVIIDHSTIIMHPTNAGGKSHLEDVSVKVEEGSETKGFTARVVCENSAGETETIEIKGTFRNDEDGKIVNINFSSGLRQFGQFFQ